MRACAALFTKSVLQEWARLVAGLKGSASHLIVSVLLIEGLDPHPGGFSGDHAFPPRHKFTEQGTLGVQFLLFFCLLPVFLVVWFLLFLCAFCWLSSKNQKNLRKQKNLEKTKKTSRKPKKLEKTKKTKKTSRKPKKQKKPRENQKNQKDQKQPFLRDSSSRQPSLARVPQEWVFLVFLVFLVFSSLFLVFSSCFWFAALAHLHCFLGWWQRNCPSWRMAEEL